jgi:hypothetical protein
MSFTKLTDAEGSLPRDRTVALLEKPCCWQTATWDDYLALRDHPEIERIRVFFDQGWLWFEMGGEGINHSKFSDLLTMMIAF